MAGLLRSLLPTKLSFLIALLVLLLLRGDLNNLRRFKFFVVLFDVLTFVIDSAVFVVLYVAVASGLLLGLFWLVSPPLIYILGGPDVGHSLKPDEEELEGDADLPPPVTSPQPDDQIPVSGSRGDSYLSGVGIYILFLVTAFPAGALLLHPWATASVLAQETIELAIRVFTHTGIAIAILTGPPLLPCIPLLMLWVAAKRLTFEPHKSVWLRAIRRCVALGCGGFLYLLSLEALARYPPPLPPSVLAHLARQAAALAPLFTWLGLCAHATLLMWVLTDAAARALLDRAVEKVMPDPAPPPPPTLPQRLARRLHTAACFAPPAAMVCSGPDGLPWAGAALAWTTGGVLTVFALDLLGFWMYFYWARRPRGEQQQWKTPVDIMALYVFGFTVRDWPRAAGETKGEGEIVDAGEDKEKAAELGVGTNSLSAAQKVIAEGAERKIYRYEMLTEAHCAVLRMDPKGYSAAYRQHAALGPGPMGTLPAPEQMASVIPNCEVHIEKEPGSSWRGRGACSDGVQDETLSGEPPQTGPRCVQSPRGFDELVALDPNQAAARRVLQQVPEDIAAAKLGVLDLNQVAPDPDSPLRLQLQQAKDSFAFTWSDIPAPHSAIPISDQQIAEYKDKPQSTTKKIFVLFEGTRPSRHAEWFRLPSRWRMCSLRLSMGIGPRTTRCWRARCFLR
ncbi:hypothetical protein B0H14DRAFT_2555219 [Mycena olivaceomarginata]|nr:hypothetical protein B0H14DRAFT_2555219 [Mycena olivaceomarginata]